MIKSEVLNHFGVKHGFFGQELTKDGKNVFEDADKFKDFKQQIKVKEAWFLLQYHSTKVCHINSLTKADGVVTLRRNLAICVKTADCIPLLMFDDKKRVVGAIHVSAKNASNGILKNAVEAFLKKSPNSLYAVLGPSLQKESYEVQSDFLHLFPEKYFSVDYGKHYFDLKYFVKDELGKFRNNFQQFEIEDIDVNTFKDERFHSYRREKKTNLRNVSYIALD